MMMMMTKANANVAPRNNLPCHCDINVHNVAGKEVVVVVGVFDSSAVHTHTHTAIDTN